MTTRSSLHRRALPPAGAAIQIATGPSRASITRALGLGKTSIVNAEAKASGGHLKAKTAALAAIGGATAVLAPEPVRAVRPFRPHPETVSDLPDALLQPRPIAPITVEVVGVAPKLIRGGPQVRDYLPPPLRPPRQTTSPITRQEAPDQGLVAPKPAPSPSFRSLAPTREDRVPQPTHDKIAPTDQALIAEALAKGNLTKLPTAVAEGGFARGVAVSQPAPMGFDPVKRKFSRGEGATRTGGFNT